jgi:hypothetical protein
MQPLRCCPRDPDEFIDWIIGAERANNEIPVQLRIIIEAIQLERMPEVPENQKEVPDKKPISLALKTIRKRPQTQLKRNNSHRHSQIPGPVDQVDERNGRKMCVLQFERRLHHFAENECLNVIGKFRKINNFDGIEIPSIVAAVLAG